MSPQPAHSSNLSGPLDRRRINRTAVILNADDFGYSSAINAAVMRAHREGVLTSASLMVAGSAVQEAAALARETPGLAVGLHLVVVGGRATLPPGEIPHLVDGNGRFPNDPFRLGLRYFLSSTAREELRRELAAQFERFAATGLPLCHVDGHLHMHMHPTVFNLLLPLAEEYGAHGLRLTRDDFWLGLSYDRRRAGIKAAWAIVFSLLSRWCLESDPGLQPGQPGRRGPGAIEARSVAQQVWRLGGLFYRPRTSVAFFSNSSGSNGLVM